MQNLEKHKGPLGPELGSDEDEVGTPGWGLCSPPTGLIPKPTFPPLLWSPCVMATLPSLGTSSDITICLIRLMLRLTEKLQEEYLGLQHSKIIYILLYLLYHSLYVCIFFICISHFSEPLEIKLEILRSFALNTSMCVCLCVRVHTRVCPLRTKTFFYIIRVK